MSDPRVISAFQRAIRDERASAKVQKALFESGIVESNLQNLHHGDRDSLGALQERTSIYGRSHALDPYASAIRFIRQAKPIARHFSHASDLAQAVQRSAFPDRYGQVARQADALRRGGGGPGGSPGVQPGSNGVSQPDGYARNGFDPGTPPQALAALLGASQASRRIEPPVTLRPAPAFAAQAPMPAGYQGIESSAPPQPPAPDPQQLQALTDLTLPKIRQPAGGGGTRGTGGALIPASRRGQVRVAANANRAGAKLSGELTNFVSLVSGRARQPITITTGTNHNRLTVNGRVSDHWDGHAGDIAVPVDSREGDRIASAALQAAGIPRARAMKLARSGGLFNVKYRGRRVQVIWKTYEGGNHHNHVHIGIR